MGKIRLALVVGLCLVGVVASSGKYNAFRSEPRFYSGQQPSVSDVGGIDPDEVLLHLQYTILHCGDGHSIKCLSDPSDVYGVGRCIPLEYRCNGIPECPMGDDEIDCPEVQVVPECAPNQVRCCDTNTCANVCDGINDCTFGQDEANCKGCLGDQVVCPDGSCAFPCDGISNCAGGEDESNCGSQITGCLAGEFVCSAGQTCATRCDGGPSECPNGEDETGCNDGICEIGQIACDSNVPGDVGEICANMCDLTVECTDGRDERQPYCSDQRQW